MLFNEFFSLRSEGIKENAYPPVTLQMDKMGNLHAWKGKHIPEQIGKYKYIAEGQESQVYLQNKDDVRASMSRLTNDEANELNNGYSIVTHNFPDDYFMSNEAKKTKKWIQKTDMKKGAFTDYCGGKVTSDCIEKGLKSDDPKTVKRASLAKTLRKIAKDK